METNEKLTVEKAEVLLKEVKEEIRRIKTALHYDQRDAERARYNTGREAEEYRKYLAENYFGEKETEEMTDEFYVMKNSDLYNIHFRKLDETKAYLKQLEQERDCYKKFLEENKQRKKS